MKRHGRELGKKSKTHTVYPSPDGDYLVRSGTSGEYYRVSEFRCTCEWADWHPSEPCSHQLAVENFEAHMFDAASLSFWDAAEDAKRQHRSIVNLGRKSPLYATIRRS